MWDMQQTVCHLISPSARKNNFIHTLCDVCPVQCGKGRCPRQRPRKALHRGLQQLHSLRAAARSLKESLMRLLIPPLSWHGPFSSGALPDQYSPLCISTTTDCWKHTEAYTGWQSASLGNRALGSAAARADAKPVLTLACAGLTWRWSWPRVLSLQLLHARAYRASACGLTWG